MRRMAYSRLERWRKLQTRIMYEERSRKMMCFANKLFQTFPQHIVFISPHRSSLHGKLSISYYKRNEGGIGRCSFWTSLRKDGERSLAIRETGASFVLEYLKLSSSHAGIALLTQGYSTEPIIHGW